MGKRIYGLRTRRDPPLSQEELGRIVGVTGATISQWENDITKFIRPENFLRLTAYFSVDPYWLVFGDKDPRTGTTGKFRRLSAPR